jgi:hypothetical protein
MSIKNKFATAVATASLLAGLFGSAFVPSALAAGRTPAIPVVKPAVTEVYSGGGVNDVSTGNAADAGKTRSFAFYSGHNSSGESAALVTGIDSTSKEADNDASIGFVLYSSTIAGVGDDLYDFAPNDLALKATSSNSNVLVAWAYDSDGEKNVTCQDIDATYNETTPAADDGDTFFAASDTVTGVYPWYDMPGFDDTNADVFPLCLAAASATTAATSTITVTANGVTAATITVTAVGPIASIALSATDGANVSEANTSVNQFWQVIAKDSAGTVINGVIGDATHAAGISSLDLNFHNLSTNPKNLKGTGSAINPWDANAAENTLGARGALQLFDLSANVCLEDTGLANDGVAEGNGDAGSSYELKIIYDATSDITSNGVTILCTGGWEGATVTSVSVDATAGDLLYEDADGYHDIYITAVIKDAAGRLMGAGLELDDASVKSASSMFTGSDSSLEGSYETNGKGEIAIGTISPDVASAKKYS